MEWGPGRTARTRIILGATGRRRNGSTCHLQPDYAVLTVYDKSRASRTALHHHFGDSPVYEFETSLAVNVRLLCEVAACSPSTARIVRSLRVRPEQLNRLGRRLAAWAAEGKTPSVQGLALSAELGPRIAAALIAKVENAGLVRREGSNVRILAAADSVDDQARNLTRQFQTLRIQDGRRLDAIERYTNSHECRAAFLRGYFGEERVEACGLCDVCRGQLTRPAKIFALLTESPARKRRANRPGHDATRQRGRRRNPTHRPG